MTPVPDSRWAAKPDPARTELALVVAHTRNRVIGLDNAMPWHLPADLQYFRRLTTGHPILMGRRTHEAIGRPLPGRRNLVLSRTAGCAAAGIEWVSSVDEALALCADAATLFVIGGAEVYLQLLPRAARLHVTEIDAELSGDTFFPPLPDGEWEEVARHTYEADASNVHTLHFVTLQRRSWQET